MTADRGRRRQDAQSVRDGSQGRTSAKLRSLIPETDFQCDRRRYRRRSPSTSAFWRDLAARKVRKGVGGRRRGRLVDLCKGGDDAVIAGRRCSDRRKVAVTALRVIRRRTLLIIVGGADSMMHRGLMHAMSAMRRILRLRIGARNMRSVGGWRGRCRAGASRVARADDGRRERKDELANSVEHALTSRAPPAYLYPSEV